MADPIDTSFIAFKFTPEELVGARALNPLQRQYFQTLRTDAAEEKLALEYDPKNELNFAQREAYLRGQMDILEMLLGSDSNIARPKRYKEVRAENQAVQTDASTKQ